MPGENPFLILDQQMLGDIYTSSEAMENLAVLCDEFGSRFSGTPEEHRAADFMRDRLVSYGLRDARLEPYEYVGWDRGEAELRVTDPVERSLDCISLPMSPPAALEAEVVDAGDGHPDTIDRLAERLKGRIALVGARPPLGLGRSVHRSEKYHRCCLAGAVAFLYVSQYPGYGPETGSIANDREAFIPGISVSHEDGAFIHRLLEKYGEAKVYLRTMDRCGTKTSYNVVADLPGSRWPNEWVILGCHYDGHDIAQGAEDPASGAVALVEAGRVLAKYTADQLGCGVRFVLFGTEEIGLIGAKRYVTQHAAELDRIRFMLNMDACGGAGRKGVVINRWPDVEERFAEWRRQMKADLPLGQKTSAYSDHYPFFLDGVPTGWIADPEGVNTGRGFGHSRYDTLDKIRLDNLRAAAGVAARLALRMACDPEWPARRRSKEEVETLIAAEPSLEGQGVREAMEALYAARDGMGMPQRHGEHGEARGGNGVRREAVL